MGMIAWGGVGSLVIPKTCVVSSALSAFCLRIKMWAFSGSAAMVFSTTMDSNSPEP